MIENVGGAGGTIGATRAAEADADGYTMLGREHGSPSSAARRFYPNLKYDSTKDFEPIGMTANAPAVVMRVKDSPGEERQGIRRVAEERTGQRETGARRRRFGTSHMACLLFTPNFGLKPKQVAYRGTGPALNDLIGGHVDYLCEQVVSVVAVRCGPEKSRHRSVRSNERLAGVAGRSVRQGSRRGRLSDQCLERGLRSEAARRVRSSRNLRDALDKTLDEPRDGGEAC